MPDSSSTPLVVAVSALAGACGIVILGVATDVRIAVLLLAIFAFAGAVGRLVLPPGATFTVRRRPIDVGVLLVLSLALFYLGLTTPLG